MPWHPPIPSEAVYSTEVAQLGAGIRLLWYVYNKVLRDGTVEFSPKAASSALSVPYETVRNWWQLLRESGIVSVEQDKGKNGFILRVGDEWLDWHVMAANYPGAAPVQRSNMPVETQDESASIDFQRPDLTAETAERSVNGFSTVGQRSNTTVEGSAYKVLMDDQNPPPPPTPSAPEPAPAAPGTAPSSAGGGGGGASAPSAGRWREHEVYRLLRGAGIAAADRLMPAWNGVPPEQVEALLAKLRKELWSADGEGRIAGRIYRAMLDGPDLLLKPPARAAPTPIPRPPAAARGDPRAIAALLLEGRPNGKPNAD